MNTASNRLGSLPRDRSALAVAVVDALSLATLIAVGLTSHGENPVTDPLGTLETAAPFVLGWFAVAVLAGVYADAVRTNPTRALRATALGWLGAANVGLILRSSPLFDGGAAWPFNLVITGVGLAVLVSWRFAYATYAASVR